MNVWISMARCSRVLFSVPMEADNQGGQDIAGGNVTNDGEMSVKRKKGSILLKKSSKSLEWILEGSVPIGEEKQKEARGIMMNDLFQKIAENRLNNKESSIRGRDDKMAQDSQYDTRLGNGGFNRISSLPSLSLIEKHIPHKEIEVIKGIISTADILHKLNSNQMRNLQDAQHAETVSREHKKMKLKLKRQWNATATHL